MQISKVRWDLSQKLSVIDNVSGIYLKIAVVKGQTRTTKWRLGDPVTLSLGGSGSVSD